MAAIGMITIGLEVLEFFLPNILRRIFWRQLIQDGSFLATPPRREIQTHDPVFDAKITNFYSNLLKGSESRHLFEILHLQTGRENILSTSLENLSSLPPNAWKLRFKIHFDDEEGQDYGGPLREWLQLLVRKLLNPNCALFRKFKADGANFTIDEKAFYVHENVTQEYFKFAGMVLGKAVYERVPLRCFFTHFLLKKLLGQEVLPEDLAVDDRHLYESIASLGKLSEQELNDADLYFVSEVSAFGQVLKTIDLEPHNRDTKVDTSNVDQYIASMCLMKMIGEIDEPLKAFVDGFHSIVPLELVSAFSTSELEQLIGGNDSIDITEIKTYAQYMNCDRETNQVQWLWKTLESFDNNERIQFIAFVTGSDRVPLGGFCGTDNGQQFTVALYPDRNTDHLPTAHTCFNRIELARYPNYDILRERLLKAITECNIGFGLK